MNFYSEKFPDGSEFMVLKSLTYFQDADLEAMPKMFITFDREECKKQSKNTGFPYFVTDQPTLPSIS